MQTIRLRTILALVCFVACQSQQSELGPLDAESEDSFDLEPTEHDASDSDDDSEAQSDATARARFWPEAAPFVADAATPEYAVRCLDESNCPRLIGAWDMGMRVWPSSTVLGDPATDDVVVLSQSHVVAINVLDGTGWSASETPDVMDALLCSECEGATIVAARIPSSPNGPPEDRRLLSLDSEGSVHWQRRLDSGGEDLAMYSGNLLFSASAVAGSENAATWLAADTGAILSLTGGDISGPTGSSSFRGVSVFGGSVWVNVLGQLFSATPDSAAFRQVGHRSEPATPGLLGMMDSAPMRCEQSVVVRDIRRVYVVDPTGGSIAPVLDIPEGMEFRGPMTEFAPCQFYGATARGLVRIDLSSDPPSIGRSALGPRFIASEPPAVFGESGLAIVGFGGGFLAMRTDTEEVVWTVETPTRVFHPAPMALDSDVLVAVDNYGVLSVWSFQSEQLELTSFPESNVGRSHLVPD